MRKTMLSFLVSAIALMSCSKDETLKSSYYEEISVSAVPSTITSFITENYPDASISTALKYSNSDTLYAITLTTYELLAFGHNESPIGESMADTLCDSIHKPNGPGHHGGWHKDRGHHGGIHNGGGIPADSIPASISGYITANFAGYTIHNAMFDTLCPYGIIINVMIDSSLAVHHKLIFDASGLFLAQAHRIKSVDLPSAITSSLAAAYSTYSIRGRAELLVLANNSKQYRVYLHKDKLRLSVIFTTDGTVVCEQ